MTRDATTVKITGSLTEGYPSGQRGQTVNLLAHAFGGSNPPPSTSFKRAAHRGRWIEPPNRCAGSTGMPEGIPERIAQRYGSEGEALAPSHPPPSTSFKRAAHRGRWIEPPNRCAGSTGMPEGIPERIAQRYGPEGEALAPSHPALQRFFGPWPGRAERSTARSALCGLSRSARCGSSSMVEPQPSKLMVRVRFPSPAPCGLPRSSR